MIALFSKCAAQIFWGATPIVRLAPALFRPRLFRPKAPGRAWHALLEADQLFQAALDQAIAKGRERIEAVEATVQLKRHTKLSL